jgi:hypothetical protein
LFSLGSSCIALLLQLYLVSSSLSQRPALGSTTCPALGGWPVAPPQLSAFVIFPSLCWVLMAPLRGWLVSLLLLSAFMPLSMSSGCWWLFWDAGLLPHPCFQPLLLFLQFTESLASCPTTILWAGSVFYPLLCCHC